MINAAGSARTAYIQAPQMYGPFRGTNLARQLRWGSRQHRAILVIPAADTRPVKSKRTGCRHYDIRCPCQLCLTSALAVDDGTRRSDEMSLIGQRLSVAKTLATTGPEDADPVQAAKRIRALAD